MPNRLCSASEWDRFTSDCLRLARTATIRITRTRARLTATMDRSGLSAGSLLARDPGSTVGTDTPLIGAVRATTATAMFARAIMAEERFGEALWHVDGSVAEAAQWAADTAVASHEEAQQGVSTAADAGSVLESIPRRPAVGTAGRFA